MRPHVVAWLGRFMPHDVAVLLAPTWFTCVGLAGLVTLLLMVRRAPRHALDPRVVASAVLWGYVAAVVAGIVVPLTIDAIEQYVAHGRIRVRWAGMTSFWGYLAGGAAVVTVCRGAGVPVARFADLAAAPLGLALILSRLGCFLAGCDFGKVTALPWAMRFPSGSPAWQAHVGGGLVPADRAASLPVHPAQLYEATVGLIMIAAAIAIGRSRWARTVAGARFLAVAASYALGRLVVEELRGDRGRGFILGLSSGQVFALTLLATIALGIVIMTHLERRLGRWFAAASVMLVIGLASAPVAEAQPATVPAAGPPAGRPRIEVTALIGGATPINRRTGQVAPLAGPSLSVGVALAPAIGVWLDLDSMANDDAAHGTVLLAGGVHRPLRPGLDLGARVGVGSTLVNFLEPTFRDVAGPTLRAEALVSYALRPRWFLAVRPLSIDVLSGDALGGPIVTWQVRIGVGYRFGPRLAGEP